jgi:hypothetical protein
VAPAPGLSHRGTAEKIPGDASHVDFIFMDSPS